MEMMDIWSRFDVFSMKMGLLEVKRIRTGRDDSVR